MIPLLLFSLWSTVEGTAFDRLTKAPVAGVVVTFGSYKAETNAAGAFRIDDVAEGEYTPVFKAPKNYFAPFGSAPACRPFRAGERAVKLDIPMIPAGSIRGRVLDSEGHPAANIRVEIFRAHGASGHFVTTDSEGRFSQTGIVPGAYRLLARPAGAELAPTYFPGTTDPVSSEAIFVREGAEMDGLDIRLRSAPTHRLRGIVKDNEGHPVAGVNVLFIAVIGFGRAWASERSGADGRFEFPKVTPGEWLLQAEYARDKTKWAGVTELTMPDRDFEKAEVRIDPPFRLDIGVEGVPRDKREQVFALLESLGRDEQGAIEDKQGGVHFPSVYPGRHRVSQLGMIPGLYVKSILLGPTDVIDSEFEVGPGSPPLRMVIASNAARAEGTVENGPGVKVVMVRSDRHMIRVEDAKGHFAFEGIRPGDWYAFAFDTADNMNWGAIREVVFDRGLVRQAAVISLQEGGAVNLKLRISPWLQ